MIEKIFDFFYKFKNVELEVEEIIELKDEITRLSLDVNTSSYYKEIYSNYLLIKGYTYRLEDSSLRLFYTFKEAIYALDLAKLTKDDEGIKLNSAVYILVINDCVNEVLGNEINLDIKNEAIEFYKKEQTKKNKENKKYHMYQN